MFQIPVKSNVFPLDNPGFIKFLNSLNIPVHYWTINDPEVMKKLINNGAKGIITDQTRFSNGSFKTRLVSN